MSERDLPPGMNVVDDSDFGGCNSGIIAEPRPGTAANVRRYIESRRRRERLFGGNLFCDPAWDILLELYAAHLVDEQLTATALCIASGAPISTALRWISALERRALITQQVDPADRLRNLFILSPEGSARMTAFFAAESVTPDG